MPLRTSVDFVRRLPLALDVFVRGATVYFFELQKVLLRIVETAQKIHR